MGNHRGQNAQRLTAFKQDWTLSSRKIRLQTRSTQDETPVATQSSHRYADRTTLAQAHAHFHSHYLDVEGLGETLDHMNAAQRLGWIRTLSPKLQKTLFDAAEGRPMTIADLVPSETSQGEEVICEGYNTLPSFKIFQKRFCRTSDPDKLSGYNHQFWGRATGPGYFTAYDDPERGEVVIDYRLLPKEGNDAWPPIIPNEARLGRFVYSGTVDRLRRVSTHVSIGRAFKDDRKAMSAWFMLCRMP